MSKTTLDNLFENLNGKFDVEEPKGGHEQRFLDKLNNQNQVAQKESKVRSFTLQQ